VNKKYLQYVVSVGSGRLDNTKHGSKRSAHYLKALLWELLVHYNGEGPSLYESRSFAAF
jgi:hypothetical protein